jgi:radical SAM superfamily enzyme YgiQ (UPF0313 family)
MKVLLINPRYNEREYRYRVNKIPPPLGISYIAKILMQDGNEAQILDMEGVQMDWNELPSFISQALPDIVGVHGTTPIAHLMKRCIKIARKNAPKATIVVGGPHATLMPESTLEQMPEVDYILRGEAEFTMRDLVRAIESDKGLDTIRTIPGICFRDNGQYTISPEMPKITDLDNLPLPAYELLPIDAYNQGSQLGESGANERFFTIMSSRGCPYRCIFCCESTLKGHKFRARSAASIVEEIEVLHNDYNINHIVFYDSSFMINPKRVERICRALIEKNLDITWRARVRADKVTEPLLELMKASGCTTLAIGAETGSQQLLDVLDKSCTIEQIEESFRIAKKVGLWTVGYFMFGIPGETKADSMETIEFAKRLDPDWALFAHSTPLPGTKLYDISDEMDMLLTHDWSRFRFSANSPVITYDGMNELEMRQLMDMAFYSFYVREEWLKNRLKKATSKDQINNIVESFFYYLNKAEHHLPGYSQDLSNKVNIDSLQKMVASG